MQEEQPEVIEPQTVETLETVPSADYSEQLQQIIDLLTEQNNLLTAISEGSSTILVYGLIVVPLFLICMMLWWFFKQFIYNY